MGKRELLLVVAFVIAGAIVYQATAPPPAPGERSFSPTRIIDNIRRGVRGNRASADLASTATFPVDGAVTNLEVTWPKGSPTEITIIGEERADIGSELNVHSRAFDDAEAQQTAKATVLKVGPAAGGLVAMMDFPREGMQTATLTLRVPSRLQVKVDAARSRTRITNVAAVEIENGRSNTEIRQVKGRVTGNYRGGDLRVAGVGSVKFTTIGADVRLEQIAGETSMNMRAGNLRGTELGGPIDVEATGVDIELEKLQKATGMMRITSTGGSVSVKGLRTDARLDARGSGVDVVVDRAVPLAIYSEGGAAVEITPPPGGYQLDAVATDGNITVPEGTVEVTTTADGHRAAGAIKGGGPLITIRTSHASITVREIEETEKKPTTLPPVSPY
jgi:hypothetical protein